MKKASVDFVISYMWIMTLLYFFEVPIVHLGILSTLIWFPSVLLSFIFCLVNLKYAEKSQVIKCMILGFILTLSFVLGGKFLSKELYVAMLCFFNSVLSISVFSSYCISERTIKFIKFCCCIISIAFIVYYKTPIAYKAINDEGIAFESETLAFNLDNSNMAGIFLYLLFCMLFVFFKKENKLIKKIFWSILMCTMLFFMNGTGTRSCMFAALATLVLGMMSSNIRRIPPFFIVITMIVPIVFILGITQLYKSGFSDMELLGKSLFTGREKMYIDMLEQVDTIPKILFGNFPHWGLQNSHNGPLTIYLSTGIIGLYLVYSIYYNAVKMMNSNSTNGEKSISIICLCCMLGLIIESSAEAALFTGGFPLVNFVTTFFIISSTEENSGKYGY